MYISKQLLSRRHEPPEYSLITDGNYEVVIEDICTDKDGRYRLTFTVYYRVTDQLIKPENITGRISIQKSYVSFLTPSMILIKIQIRIITQ